MTRMAECPFCDGVPRGRRLDRWLCPVCNGLGTVPLTMAVEYGLLELGNAWVEACEHDGLPVAGIGRWARLVTWSSGALRARAFWINEVRELREKHNARYR